MNNTEKYELIVKIKELLVETEIKEIDEFKNHLKISLDASKVFSLIYSHKFLTDFYNRKLEEYKTLMNEKEKFKNALRLRNKQFSIMSVKETDILLISSEFTYVQRLEYENIFNTIGKEYKDRGIFCYIDNILTKYPAVDEIKYFTIDDNDEYRKKIATLYDYWHFSKYERFIGMVYFLFQTEQLFLYLAYTKILNDCLEELYNVNLSEQEKQENSLFYIETKLSEKKINFDLPKLNIVDLTSSERKILNIIINTFNRENFYSILKNEKCYAEHSIKTMINRISDKFKSIGLISRGGYNPLRDYFNSNQDLIYEVNKSKQK